MTRMLLLAALALACVLPLSPAFSMAYPPEWGSPGDPAGRFTIAALAGLAFFAAAALASLVFTRGRLGRFRAAGPVAVAVLLVCLTAPAFAADDATVTISAGPWIEMVREILLTIVIPVISYYVVQAVRKNSTIGALFLTQSRVEQLGNAATEFAINAIPGAVKEAKLSMSVGSAVIAKAVQYGIDAAPAKAMEAAGGPEGLAKIVFRKLNLEDEADEANTLLPAIAAVRAK
jgi:hypothetical protein